MKSTAFKHTDQFCSKKKT